MSVFGLGAKGFRNGGRATIHAELPYFRRLVKLFVKSFVTCANIFFSWRVKLLTISFAFGASFVC
jgi:hypothetical protein